MAPSTTYDNNSSRTEENISCKWTRTNLSFLLSPSLGGLGIQLPIKLILPWFAWGAMHWRDPKVDSAFVRWFTGLQT
jgi:hypothetical protein